MCKQTSHFLNELQKAGLQSFTRLKIYTVKNVFILQ